MDVKMEVRSKSLFSLWKQRIGYGVSDLACNLIWQMISLYLLYFYTDVMKLDAMAISLMFVVTRVIDAGTDLLIGYCIDHTHTKWGKSRPYFLFGAIPFALFAVLAFSVPNISATGKLVYAYITYIGLSFMYTVVNIPMASILPNLTSDKDERTMLSTSRKFFAFLGSTIVSSCSLGLVAFFGESNEAQGFRIVMIIFGVIGCLLFFFTFATVEERIDAIKIKKVTLKDTLKSLAVNGPWKLFALNIIFMWTGFFLQSSALIYYFSYNVGNRAMATLVASIMALVPMIVNFFVPVISKKMGKRNLYVASAGMQLVGLLVIWLGDVNTNIIITGAIISAAGYGMKESIYFSIQADPVDYGEWKTGINTAGTLSSINGFLGKCAQALSGGLGGMLLAWGSYQSGVATQSNEALVAIKAMYIYIPVILLVCSIITMMFYHLDKDYPRIKAELEKRNEESNYGNN